MSDIVERLRDDQPGERQAKREARMELGGLLMEASDEIEKLREKCNTQAMILRRLVPDKFPNTYFIHGELGEKDQNGMPEKIMVVPAYGVDFTYIYTREEKTVGPEW